MENEKHTTCSLALLKIIGCPELSNTLSGMEVKGEVGNVVFEGLVFSQGQCPCVSVFSEGAETLRSRTNTHSVSRCFITNISKCLVVMFFL